jgi:hypothetical protein
MATNQKPPPPRTFTREDKAIHVLTRSGPYSRMQAAEMVRQLELSELEELVALHDQLAAPQATLAEFLNRLSDRLNPPPKEQADRSPDGIPDLDPGRVSPAAIDTDLE